jgi:hypothetical protein
MQTAWQNIYNKTQIKGLKYKISFTGGEVTANKNFLPLTKWLREQYQDIDMIIITTNGSASLNYYRKLSQYVEAMSFSTHSEFMDEADFFSKVEKLNQIMIRPEKSFHVNIMDEHWNQDRISLYQQWLTEKNISHSVNRIDYQHRTRDEIVSHGKKNFEILRKSS